MRTLRHYAHGRLKPTVPRHEHGQRLQLRGAGLAGFIRSSHVHLGISRPASRESLSPKDPESPSMARHSRRRLLPEAGHLFEVGFLCASNSA